jgi:hypothetical protein
MEKDIGKIKKNDNTDIMIRVDDFGGKKGVTIREYVSSERYTGFTKSGVRIPAEEFINFRELVNSVNISDLKSDESVENTGKSKKAGKPEQEEIEDY